MLTVAAIALSLLQVKHLEGTVASLQESRSHRDRITAPSDPGYYAQSIYMYYIQWNPLFRTP